MTAPSSQISLVEKLADPFAYPPVVDLCREAASTLTTLLALRDALHLENEELRSTITRLTEERDEWKRAAHVYDHVPLSQTPNPQTGERNG